MRNKRYLRTGILLVFALALTGICINGPKAILLQPDEVIAGQPDESETITYIPITASEQAYRLILEGGDRSFRGGYAIDESFLLWVESVYGGDVIMDLAYSAFEGQTDPELWYELTGKSIHVLWLDYCAHMGYDARRFANVNYRECSSGQEIVLDFIGDINFAEDWMTMLALKERENGMRDCISADIIKEFRSADIFMLNNEFTYSRRGEPLEGKTYTFRADPSRAAFLQDWGTDIVSVANNHVYDFGEDALLDTLQTIRDAGIAYVGAGVNLDEAKAVQYFVANGRKLAFVSATQIERTLNYTKAATATTAGVFKTTRPALVSQAISEAKKTSDYVIVYVHWGIEGQNQSEESQDKLARIFVDAGADAIIGAHPHRMQGVGYVDGVPVVYSLGNFWFSDATLYSMIAQLKIGTDGQIGLRMIPCLQKDLAAYLVTGESKMQSFYRYVADYSTDIAISADGWVYDLTKSDGVDGLVYFSGQDYGSIEGGVDLEGRRIDIVGNLK